MNQYENVLRSDTSNRPSLQPEIGVTSPRRIHNSRYPVCAAVMPLVANHHCTHTRTHAVPYEHLQRENWLLICQTHSMEFQLWILIPISALVAVKGVLLQVHNLCDSRSPSLWRVTGTRKCVKIFHACACECFAQTAPAVWSSFGLLITRSHRRDERESVFGWTWIWNGRSMEFRGVRVRHCFPSSLFRALFWPALVRNNHKKWKIYLSLWQRWIELFGGARVWYSIRDFPPPFFFLLL